MNSHVGFLRSCCLLLAIAGSGCGANSKCLSACFGSAGTAGTGAGPIDAGDGPDLTGQAGADGGGPDLTGQAGADGGGPDVGGPPNLTGAYDITVPSAYGGASRTFHLYLVRVAAEQYQARITRECDAAIVTAAALRLPYCPQFFGDPRMFEATGERFDNFVLARDGSGALTGQATARNDRVTLGQTNANTVVNGSVVRSTAAPEVHVVGGRPGRTMPWETMSVRPITVSLARPLMPWDPIKVTFGAGIAVDESVLARDLAITTSAGVVLAPTFTFDPDPATPPHVGALSASASQAWASINGQTLRVSLPAGTADFAGNASTVASEDQAMIAAVAAPVTGWTFDGGSIGLAAWATVTSVQGTADCDGGCIHLGPDIAPGEEPGAAGRLDTRGATKVVIRWRAVMAAVFNSFEASVSLGKEPVRPFSGPADLRQEFENPTLDLGATAGALHLATPWMDAEIPLPADLQGGDIAFELRLSALNTTTPSVQNAALVIDSIVVR